MPAAPARHPSVAIALKLVTVALLLAGLPSCAGNDREYHSLASAVELNPQPDAIVGMWHRKYTDGMGLSITQSLYFRKDHTGYWDHLGVDVNSHYDQSGHLTWSYGGNGVWKWTTADTSHEYRLAGSKLLQMSKGGGIGAGYRVYTRVSE